jgi:DNA-directed RNA polymerase subunit alpha
MNNLGILYEDLGRDEDAVACYQSICDSHPMDERGRLYLRDAIAATSMYYDEDLERKEDRLNQILRTPITDFELSVRARNCLAKMDIITLGDLVRKTENELLTYKNFGETSLQEIKEILTSKGLRLGMQREEAVHAVDRGGASPVTGDPNDPRNRSISELKLSIRARRTVENLGCLTLGEVIVHSEDELLGMPNFGVTSLLELKGKLTELGLHLKGDD